MDELRKLTRYYSAIAGILQSAEAGLNTLVNNYHEKEFITNFKRAIGGYFKNISTETVKFYSTEGYSYKTALSVLRDEKNNIPCVAVRDNNSQSVLIAVPRYCESKANAIIDSLSHLQIKNEQSRTQFMRSHLGAECAVFDGVNKDMQYYIRNALVDKPINFSFEKKADGGYKLYCSQKDREVVAAYVYQAKAITESERNKELRFYSQKQNLSVKDIEMYMSKDSGNDIYFADASGKSSDIYRIHDGNLETVTSSGCKVVYSGKGMPVSELNANIRATVADMQLPIVRSVRKDSLLSGCSIDSIFEAKAITKIKNELAEITSGDSKIGLAQEFASQLAYQYCFGAGLSQTAIDSLNRSVSFSQYLTAYDASNALDGLKKQLTDLALNEQEQTRVMEYVKGVVGEFEKSETVQEINVNNLDIRDIQIWIGKETEYELEHSQDLNLSQSVDVPQRTEGI